MGTRARATANHTVSLSGECGGDRNQIVPYRERRPQTEDVAAA